MFKISFSDYIEFIKRNKLLFFLVNIGLLAISFASLLIVDTIRYNFVANLKYEGTTQIAYIYENPISGRELYEKLNEVGISSLGLVFVSEQSHLNEPAYDNNLLECGRFSIANTRVDFKDLGVVGYKESSFYAREGKVYTGRYFNSSDSGTMNCIVYGSVELSDIGTVSAYGYDFEVIGTTFNYGELMPYDRSSAIVTPETFAMLDIPLDIVNIDFVIPPMESYANKIISVLDSFGEHQKTKEPLAYFNIWLIFNFLSSFILYFAALGIVMSMLILIFKCWISSQQSVFRIYSICGITSQKLLLMRLFQVVLFYIPSFVVASVIYVILTVSDYKNFTYTLGPATFIINFISILIILFIMTYIQNRRNSGYEVLKDI